MKEETALDIIRVLEDIVDELGYIDSRLKWIAFGEQQKHFNSYEEYQTKCRNCKRRMRFDYLKLEDITPDDLVQPTCPGCEKNKG